MKKSVLFVFVLNAFSLFLNARQVIKVGTTYVLQGGLPLYKGKSGSPSFSTKESLSFVINKAAEGSTWFELKSKKTGKIYYVKQDDFHEHLQGPSSPQKPVAQNRATPTPAHTPEVTDPPVVTKTLPSNDNKLLTEDTLTVFIDREKRAHDALSKVFQNIAVLDPYSFDSFDTNNAKQAHDFLLAAKSVSNGLRGLAFNIELTDEERKESIEAIEQLEANNASRLKEIKKQKSTEDFDKWIEYRKILSDLKYAISDKSKTNIDYTRATESGDRILALVRSSSFFPSAMKLYQLSKNSADIKPSEDFSAHYKHFNRLSLPELVNKELYLLEKYPKLTQKFYNKFESDNITAGAYDLNAQETRSYFVTNTIKPDALMFAKLEGYDKKTYKPIVKISPATPESKDALRHVLDKGTLNVKSYLYENSQLYYKVVFGNSGPEFIVTEAEFRRLTQQDALWNLGPATLITDKNPKAGFWASLKDMFHEPPVEGDTYFLARKPKQATNLSVNDEFKALGYSEKGFVFESLSDQKKYIFPEDSWYEFIHKKKLSSGFLPEWIFGHDEPLMTDIDPNLIETYKDPQAGELISNEILAYEKKVGKKEPRFKKLFNPLAQHIFQLTGFPPDIFLGQVAEESTWGTSNVFQKTNNTTGVSCTKRGKTRTETIPFLVPPLTITATCEHPRPKEEDGYYYKFNNLYEATMFQVWNLLYNPATAEIYSQSREAAQNILAARDKEAAIIENQDLFVAGMAKWATNTKYTEIMDNRMKKVQRVVEGIPLNSDFGGE